MSPSFFIGNLAWASSAYLLKKLGQVEGVLSSFVGISPGAYALLRNSVLENEFSTILTIFGRTPIAGLLSCIVDY